MLVLKRRVGESIFVGDAEVILTRNSRGHLCLGVIADKSIPVHRREVYERIKAAEASRPADQPAGPAAE